MDQVAGGYASILTQNVKRIYKKHFVNHEVFFLCTRRESNPYYEIRNLASYPLNDGCAAKIFFRVLYSHYLR